MFNANSSPDCCGDLALLQNIAQTYTDEIKSLLFIQYRIKTNRLELDLNKEIDARLMAVSKLNHLLVKRAATAFPQDTVTNDEHPSIESKVLLCQLQQINVSAKQNLELINSMQRFIKDKVIKQQLKQFAQTIQCSVAELDQKETSLSQCMQLSAKPTAATTNNQKR